MGCTTSKLAVADGTDNKPFSHDATSLLVVNQPSDEEFLSKQQQSVSTRNLGLTQCFVSTRLINVDDDDTSDSAAGAGPKTSDNVVQRLPQRGIVQRYSNDSLPPVTEFANNVLEEEEEDPSNSFKQNRGDNGVGEQSTGNNTKNKNDHAASQEKSAAPAPPLLPKRPKPIGQRVESTGSLDPSIVLAAASAAAERNRLRQVVVNNAAAAAAFAARRDQLPLDSPLYKKSPAEIELLSNALKHHFLFAHRSPEHWKPLLKAFERVQYETPGQVIIRKGEVGDFFYIVAAGAVSFQVDEGKPILNDKGVPAVASAGSCFGELALLCSSPRAATVLAEEVPVTAFRIHGTTFQHLVHQQRALSDEEKLELLRNIPPLQELDDEVALRQLASQMIPHVYEPGQSIAVKGQDTLNFFVIQSGEARVTGYSVGGGQTDEKDSAALNGNNNSTTGGSGGAVAVEVMRKTYEDFTLHAGDSFGEQAMIRKEPAMANVVALTRCMTFVLDREAFERAIGHDLSALSTRKQDKLILGAIKQIKDTRLNSAKLALLANLVEDRWYEKGTKIFVEGETVEAALYLLRQGRVQITCSATGEQPKIVVQGGYFGEEQLMRDVSKKQKRFGNQGQRSVSHSSYCQLLPSDVVASYTVEALDDCQCGVLTLKECRTVFDSRFIGSGLRTSFASVLHLGRDVKLKELKKCRILGEGNFGQVWLVMAHSSDDNHKKGGETYALKIQSKYELIQCDQVAGILREREILGQLNHPFIMRLVNTYKDVNFIYMLLGFVQGGELLGRYEAAGFNGLPETDARFYAACIFDALFHMHRRMIVYRDLKPENILIDDEGYVVIVDFGFAKVVEFKTYTLLGSPLYMAPEIIRNAGHGQAADIWSLGVMIYEMLTGEHPFCVPGMDQLRLFASICSDDLPTQSSKIPMPAYHLIDGLLRKNPYDRFGSLAEGENEIARHDWFTNGNIDWDKLRRKEIEAPWFPKVADPLDASNFHSLEAEDKTRHHYPAISPTEEKLFDDF